MRVQKQQTVEQKVVTEEPVVEEELLILPVYRAINLAPYYNLIVDNEDFEEVSKHDWNLFINDSYRKFITAEQGTVTIQGVLGLNEFNISFKNGNDLDYRRDNLILTSNVSE